MQLSKIEVDVENLGAEAKAILKALFNAVSHVLSANSIEHSVTHAPAEPVVSGGDIHVNPNGPGGSTTGSGKGKK